MQKIKLRIHPDYARTMQVILSGVCTGDYRTERKHMDFQLLLLSSTLAEFYILMERKLLLAQPGTKLINITLTYAQGCAIMYAWTNQLLIANTEWELHTMVSITEKIERQLL